MDVPKFMSYGCVRSFGNLDMYKLINWLSQWPSSTTFKLSPPENQQGAQVLLLAQRPNIHNNNGFMYAKKIPSASSRLNQNMWI